MARIQWIEEAEATGALAQFYAQWRAENPGRPTIPGIYRTMSLRPDLLQGMKEVSEQVLFADGHLTRRQKEMIATYVSALNECSYCRGSHEFFLSLHDPNPDLHTRLGTANLDGAPVSDGERALLQFAKKVTERAGRVADEDVEALRQLGWTDPQIAESVYTAALFAFFNRLANSFGLPDPDYFHNRVEARTK